MPRRDLTAKRGVAELLRESAMRFRSLSALSADVYWEQDEQLRFTSFSGASSREFEPGHIERLIGRTRWETHYVNMTEADWAAHRALLDARRPFHDLELCRYDAAGRKAWTRVSGEPVFDASGAFKGYRGIARNITERRRAEELRELEHAVTRSLAEAEDAATGLQAVIRAVCRTEGWECGRYFRVDEQAGVLRFADGWSVPDAAFERFVVLSRDLVYRPGVGLSGLAWQKAQALWATDVSKDPRSSKGPAKIGSREIGIHGAFVFPIVSDGKTIGVLNFASRKAREPGEQLLQAITAIGGQIGQFLQRRQADEQRRVLEGQLRQAQKMQAIGTLATGIAHEFNNALRAILANVELARMDLGPEHPVRGSIEEIDRAGRRARDIVQQILAFARPQALQRRCLALPEVAQEALRLLRVTLPPRIELATDFSPDTPAVLADATQIHQLLVNLCTNASQAMRGESGRIVIRLSDATLGAEALHAMPGLQPGRFARLSVSDSGTGIDPVVREHIFDPFFSTKPAGEGTGLGLAVVHGIVQAHEGAIDVESAAGKGTTFCVYFPAAQDAATPGATDEASVRADGRGRHVLFLDDNQELVSAMVRTLPRHGYRVSGHTAAEAALDAVRTAPQAYDLVVTDYKMPGLSGLDVARELARIRADLPVVIISGYIDRKLQETARELGVRQLLNKLHTSEELLDAIDRLTGTRVAP
jgi:PAS domain S-box-containing protein